MRSNSWPVLPGPRGVLVWSGKVVFGQIPRGRDDAVSPAGPSLFETGMDLLDVTLGSGGGDQVRVRGRGSSGVSRVGIQGRPGARPGGDCVSCWGRAFIQDDCTLAPVICDRTLSSCGKYVPDRNWRSEV